MLGFIICSLLYFDKLFESLSFLRFFVFHFEKTADGKVYGTRRIVYAVAFGILLAVKIFALPKVGL
jgi:hypothetical protein